MEWYYAVCPGMIIKFLTSLAVMMGKGDRVHIQYVNGFGDTYMLLERAHSQRHEI